MQRQHRDALTPLMRIFLSLAIVASLAIGLGCLRYPKEAETNPAVKAQRVSAKSFDSKIEEHAETLLEEGRKIFRFDTFGSEGYWGDKLRLHEAIMGEQQGGVGPHTEGSTGSWPQGRCRSPSWDLDRSPQGDLGEFGQTGNHLVLLRANAVVGVTGFFDKEDRLQSIGIQCAFCHSTVDDSFANGIGRRLDGWPNRDLDVG